MAVKALFALYPLLQGDYRAVEKALLALEESGASYRVFPTHSEVSGKEEEVFLTLQRAFQKAAEEGALVMWALLTNACEAGDPFRKEERLRRFPPGEIARKALEGLKAKSVLDIGTGTGVTPYRAMLPQLKHMMDTRGVDVVLLFGSRTEEDLIYREDFYAFAAENPKFRFMPCFSREVPANATADARRGYVQEQLAELVPNGAHDIAYLCGNPNMVDASFEALKEFGLSVQHIRREKYVSSK